MKSKLTPRQQEIARSLKNLNQRMRESMKMFEDYNIDLKTPNSTASPVAYLSSKLSHLISKVSEGSGELELEYNKKTGLLKQSQKNLKILDYLYEEERRKGSEKSNLKMHNALIGEMDKIRLGRIYAVLSQEFKEITPPEGIKGTKELEKYFNSLDREGKKKLFQKTFDEYVEYSKYKEILDQLYSYNSKPIAEKLGYGKGQTGVNYNELIEAIQKFMEKNPDIETFDPSKPSTVEKFMDYVKFEYEPTGKNKEKSVADKVKEAEESHKEFTSSDYE